MKALNNNQKSFYVSLFLNKNFAIFISVLLSLAVLNLSISCSYYNVRNVPTTEETVSKQIKDFNDSEKYVIIHSNDKSWHLNNMIINEDSQTISGEILPINTEHFYLNKSTKIKRNNSNKVRKDSAISKNKKFGPQSEADRNRKKVHRYKWKKSKPLDELHFYLKTPTSFSENTTVSIPLSDIREISVNDNNSGRAIANIFLGTVGTMFVALLLYAALKSSCPFVYIKNGEEFDFIGELYPGTITANMEKDDFLPLPNFSPKNREYVLKITNQLKEIQYTDQVQLLQINHSKDVEVLIDSKGQIQTFKNIVAPINVIVDDVKSNREASLEKDNNFYAFNTSKKVDNSTRNIVLNFDKPEEIKDAKLYLTAKNSVWLDYVFGKFNEQFGVYYNTFQKQQQNVESDSIKNWKNGQNIPLSVYVKTNKNWQLVERINTVGPMAMRNIVVPLKLNNIRGDKLEIKLETGFMFWEVDFVGVDFSENFEVELNYINPSKAIDLYGNDVVNLLMEADKNYFVQPNIGDEVSVHFPSKVVKEDLKQSIFLKNRGYYNYIRDYKGIPDFEKLEAFKEDNTFTRFSEKAYFNFVNFDLNKLAYHE